MKEKSEEKKVKNTILYLSGDGIKMERHITKNPKAGGWTPEEFPPHIGVLVSYYLLRKGKINRLRVLAKLNGKEKKNEGKSGRVVEDTQGCKDRDHGKRTD